MIHPFFKSLLENAEARPSEPFFELFGNGEAHKVMSFANMRERIAGASAFLQSKGLKKGDIVLIFAQHSEGMLLSFFGAQWHGAIPAFMPPPTVKQDIEAWTTSHKSLLERISPAVIIAEPGCMDHVRGLGGNGVISTDCVEQALSPTDLRPKIDADDLDAIAFLQHSSGTTGLKKGVMVTYRQLLAQLDNYSRAIGFSASSNIVSWLPLYHDMGLIAATMMPFRFGSNVKIIDTFVWLSKPDIFISLLENVPDAFAWLPNFAFNYLAKRTRNVLSEQSLSGVSAIINCSEPCRLEDMKAFQQRFVPYGLKETAVQVCYAMAEYVFAVAQTSLKSHVKGMALDADELEQRHIACPVSDKSVRAKTVVCVGNLIEETEVRIGEGLSDGCVGEVFVRGPSKCSGYFRNPELTKTKFVEGWYSTADLGFKYNGELYITGRVDDLIIVRGKNIYAHDLEVVAGSVNGIKAGRSVAFGIEDEVSGTQNLILIAEVDGFAETKSIKLDIGQKVFDLFGLMPTDIILVKPNSLVKTTSGKISRSQNSKKYLKKDLEKVELI